MNVLLVHAHPEPGSLNGALRDFSIKRLEAAGHHVQLSDLYAMNWKAVLDANDSTAPPGRHAFRPVAGQRPRVRERNADGGYRRRTGQAALGGRRHPAVSAVVVLDAGHPERLGGSRLRPWFRLRRR
uniref:NAD(P)H-dependent oxidoreductase n=1 Tax=Microvirgula aerodenitrificans TaxID=57480 RepID=UPI001B80887A